MRVISESVMGVRYRGEEMREKGVDGGQSGRKTRPRSSFLDIAVEHLSVKKVSWSVRRNDLVSMVARQRHIEM